MAYSIVHTGHNKERGEKKKKERERNWSLEASSNNLFGRGASLKPLEKPAPFLVALLRCQTSPFLCPYWSMAYGLIQTKDGGSGYRNIDEREAAGFQISTEYGVGNHSEVHSLPKNME